MSIDPYYCIFGGIGFPDNWHDIPMPEGFLVYLLCDTQDKRRVFVYLDRQEFNKSDKCNDKNVYRLFLQLSKKLENCEKANDLFQFYDKKELHKALDVKIDGNDIPVYRIRKSDIRVYLIFVNSDIVLFRLSIKTQQKIDDTEKSILESRMKAIFAYQGKEFQKRVMS